LGTPSTTSTPLSQPMGGSSIHSVVKRQVGGQPGMGLQSGHVGGSGTSSSFPQYQQQPGSFQQGMSSSVGGGHSVVKRQVGGQPGIGLQSGHVGASGTSSAFPQHQQQPGSFQQGMSSSVGGGHSVVKRQVRLYHK
jgi:hypothetical protein